MRFTSKRVLVPLVAAAALLVGGGTALAAAGGRGFFGFFGFGGGSQTTVLNDVASNLGVSPAKLRTAIKDALKAQVDRQVKDGLVTSTQAAAIKERIDDAGVGVTAGGPGFGIDQLDLLEAAASYLDLSPSALRDQLAAGNSLADVAKAKGKSTDGLQAALVDKVTSDLAAAVSAGDLSDSDRDALLTRFKNTVATLITIGPGRLGRGGFGHPRGGIGALPILPIFR